MGRKDGPCCPRWEAGPSYTLQAWPIDWRRKRQAMAMGIYHSMVLLISLSVSFIEQCEA